MIYKLNTLSFVIAFKNSQMNLFFYKKKKNHQCFVCMWRGGGACCELYFDKIACVPFWAFDKLA